VLALLFPKAELMSQVLFVMVLKESLDLNAELGFALVDPCDCMRIAGIGLEEGEGRVILGLGLGEEELKNDEALGVPCALLVLIVLVLVLVLVVKLLVLVA